MRRATLAAVSMFVLAETALPQATSTTTAQRGFLSESGQPILLDPATGAVSTTDTTTSTTTQASNVATTSTSTSFPTDVCLMAKLDLDRTTTLSTDCMRCHDGSSAVDARTGHRFDIKYAPDGERFRASPDQYNSRVVLVNGTVACTTCHDPASSLSRHVAAPLDGPLERRLCIACHIQ